MKRVQDTKEAARNRLHIQNFDTEEIKDRTALSGRFSIVSAISSCYDFIF